MLLKKVVPAIKEKWLAGDRGQTITIQEDTAGPHIDNNDNKFCSTINGIQPSIKLGCQPTQSPKTNVLNLGLFYAINCAWKKFQQQTLKSWWRRYQRHLTQFRGKQ